MVVKIGIDCEEVQKTPCNQGVGEIMADEIQEGLL